jgi:hypothetical protein
VTSEPRVRPLASALSRLRWVEVVGLGAPIALLTVLALHDLGEASFWRDEVASVVFAKATVGELLTLVGRDRERVGLVNMATYYLILHFWLFIGETEARIRLLSVLAGVLAVVPVYFAARHIAGWLAGGLAAATFALLPFVIRYSQEARGYSLSMLAAGGLTWLVLVGVERRALWPWLTYGILATLGLYVHFFVALVIGAHGLWLLATRQVPGWRESLMALAPMAVGVIPILLAIGEYGGGHLWLSGVTLDQVATVFSGLLGSPLAVLAAFGLGAVAVLAQRTDRRLWLLVATALLPIVVTVILSMVKPLLAPRYLVVSLPAIAVMMGCGLVALRNQWRVVGIMALAAVMLVNVPRAYGDIHQQDWRGAARWILRDAVSGDRMIVRGFGWRPLDYYLDRYRAGAPLPRQTSPAGAVKNRAIDRVWLVVTGNFNGALPPLPPALDQAFDVVETRPFAAKVTVVLLERVAVPAGG